MPLTRALYEIWRPYARWLRQHPGSAVMALLTLALGIGGGVAIFTVADQVLWQPLPYPSSEQLVMAWVDNTVQSNPRDRTSYPNYLDWRDQSTSFRALAGYTTTSFNVAGEGDPERVPGARVTANFFATLGLRPILGRDFQPAEEEDGRNDTVILSHQLWQRRFGGDPGVLDQRLQLDGETVTIVGVAPPGFDFPAESRMWQALAPRQPYRSGRGFRWLEVVGRLKDDVAPRTAQAEMAAISQRLAERYPAANKGYGSHVEPLLETVTGGSRRTLLLLLAAAAALLLVACVNVANLLLTRALSRDRELAVRHALGASRSRLIRQLIGEAVVPCFLGGVAGLVVAQAGIAVLRALSPAELPRLNEIAIDVRTLLAALALAALTCLLCGLIPALQASRPELDSILKEGGRSGHARRRRSISALVSVEIALALLTLIGAGLLVASFLKLQAVSPGFNADGVVLMQTQLPRSRYQGPRALGAFTDDLLARVKALPGVEKAAITSSVLEGSTSRMARFVVEGRAPDPPGQQSEIVLTSVSPGFFSTLGIPLLRGRDFSTLERPEDGGEEDPVIINETMSRRFWPGEDPVGQRFKYGDLDSRAPWMTIVGVVGDVRARGLDLPPLPTTFTLYEQWPRHGFFTVLKTARTAAQISPLLRQQVWAIDEAQSISQIAGLSDLQAEQLAPRRLGMLLLISFAATALLLALVGVYGAMSYAVNQSLHEIGIHLAVGAEPRDIRNRMLRRSAILSLIGIAAGLFAAAFSTRYMASLVFAVDPLDPTVYLGMSALILACSLAASHGPVRRAMRVDPLIILRSETERR